MLKNINFVHVQRAGILLLYIFIGISRSFTYLNIIINSLDAVHKLLERQKRFLFLSEGQKWDVHRNLWHRSSKDSGRNPRLLSGTRIRSLLTPRRCWFRDSVWLISFLYQKCSFMFALTVTPEHLPTCSVSPAGHVRGHSEAGWEIRAAAGESDAHSGRSDTHSGGSVGGKTSHRSWRCSQSCSSSWAWDPFESSLTRNPPSVCVFASQTAKKQNVPSNSRVNVWLNPVVNPTVP